MLTGVLFCDPIGCLSAAMPEGEIPMTAYTIPPNQKKQPLILGAGDTLTVDLRDRSTDVTVNDGASESVNVGGSSFRTTVNDGGKEFVNGGTADVDRTVIDYTTINGGGVILDHATANNTRINFLVYQFHETNLCIGYRFRELTVSLPFDSERGMKAMAGPRRSDRPRRLARMDLTALRAMRGRERSRPVGRAARMLLASRRPSFSRRGGGSG